MSDVEKFEAIHPDVRVPMSAVRAVRVVDEAWPERSSLRRYGVARCHRSASSHRRAELGGVRTSRDEQQTLRLDGCYSLRDLPSAEIQSTEIIRSVDRVIGVGGGHGNIRSSGDEVA